MKYNIVLIGLNGCGRTSLLKYLRKGDGGDDVYEVQCNEDTLCLRKGVAIGKNDGVLFCIDGSDLEVLPESKGLFDRMVDEGGIPWAIVQTKSDKQTIDAQELA
jgi:hypothetical protein